MIGCLPTQTLAFLAVFVYATHATQAIALEWKPGLSVRGAAGAILLLMLLLLLLLWWCADINECEFDNGGCSQLCQNTDGSFHCTCHIGFQLGNDAVSCFSTLTILFCNHFCTNDVSRHQSDRRRVAYLSQRHVTKQLLLYNFYFFTF